VTHTLFDADRSATAFSVQSRFPAFSQSTHACPCLAVRHSPAVRTGVAAVSSRLQHAKP